MGHGIAQVFLAAGHSVVLYDTKEEALHFAEDQLKNIFDLLGEEPDLARLSFQQDLEQAVAEADFVFEAVPEVLELKQTIFCQVAGMTRPDTVLASNTSAIPIGRIASAVSEPGCIIGTHFWNPPWAVSLVEVVQAKDTRPDIVRRTLGLLEQIGMKPVHVKCDIPGFIGNRLQHALKREAIALLEAGVCDAETIDKVVKYGFGKRLAVLGPLEQSDLVGLDLTLKIHEILMPVLDNTPRPASLLVENIENGNLGMKTGRGFHDWSPESAAATRQHLASNLAASARERLADLRKKRETEGYKPD